MKTGGRIVTEICHPGVSNLILCSGQYFTLLNSQIPIQVQPAGGSVTVLFTGMTIDNGTEFSKVSVTNNDQVAVIIRAYIGYSRLGVEYGGGSTEAGGSGGGNVQMNVQSASGVFDLDGTLQQMQNFNLGLLIFRCGFFWGQTCSKPQQVPFVPPNPNVGPVYLGLNHDILTNVIQPGNYFFLPPVPGKIYVLSSISVLGTAGDAISYDVW